MSILKLKKPHELESGLPNIFCGDYIPIIENSPTMLYSQGGIGKSFAALRLAIVFLKENRTKKAMLWLSEDPEGETRYRFFETCKILGVNYNEIKDRIDITDQTPTKLTRMEGNNCVSSNEYYELRKEFINFDLVVMDPLLQFQGGEENSNTHAGVFMGLIKTWSKEDALTIVLLHHATVTEYGLKARGASDWTNGTRATYKLSKIMKTGENGKLEEDEEKKYKRIVTLWKDNGLSRYLLGKYKSKDLEIDVFPKETEIRYQDKNGRYTAVPKKPTPEKPVHISLANHNSEHNADGFVKKEVSWNGLVDLITSNMAYSPSFFKDGHRSSQNYLGGNEVVFLDIDEGLTFEEGKEMFKNLKAILITTKSHQKMKNGIIADRFRVVLQLDTPINLDKSEYKIAMQAIFDMFGSVADQSTKDPARFFFSSPTDCQVHYTKSENLFNWRDPYNAVRRLQNIESQKNKQSMNFEYKDITLQHAADALNRLDPDCEYSQWVECGMALQAEFGNAGYQVWDDWSRRGSKYNEREMQNKWRSFNGSGIKIGTLFHYSKASA